MRSILAGNEVEAAHGVEIEYSDELIGMLAGDLGIPPSFETLKDEDVWGSVPRRYHGARMRKYCLESFKKPIRMPKVDAKSTVREHAYAQVRSPAILQGGTKMKAIDVCAQVVGKRQCVIFRAKKDAPGEYDVKDVFGQGHNKSRKEGWVLLDLFTASRILLIWEALSQQNREKLERMPLPRMADVAFKVG